MLDQQLLPNTTVEHLSLSFNFHLQLSKLIWFLILMSFSTTTKSSNSKQFDSLLLSYTELWRFLSPSTSLTFLTAPIPVLPDFDSVVHQQGVKEEYECLERAHDDKTSDWVPWAKHHAGKHQLVIRLPDLSAILPPIDEPVHTLDMQYHCMNIISNTINTFSLSGEWVNLYLYHI